MTAQVFVVVKYHYLLCNRRTIDWDARLLATEWSTVHQLVHMYKFYWSIVNIAFFFFFIWGNIYYLCTSRQYIWKTACPCSVYETSNDGKRQKMFLQGCGAIFVHVESLRLSFCGPNVLMCRRHATLHFQFPQHDSCLLSSNYWSKLERLSLSCQLSTLRWKWPQSLCCIRVRSGVTCSTKTHNRDTKCTSKKISLQSAGSAVSTVPETLPFTDEWNCFCEWQELAPCLFHEGTNCFL